MNRFKAFAIHLGISAAVLAVILYFVFVWWYPDFFFASDGGGQGLRLVLLVDLVLGPVLTLVVFNPTKPELKRDLTIIGTLQAVCLAAGVYVVWSERPLALVYTDGLFYSVSTDDYGLVPDLSSLPGPSPKRVCVVLPDDPVASAQIRSDAWRAGRPLRIAHERYQAWDSCADHLEEPLDNELVRSSDPGGLIDQWEQQHGPLDGFAFYPYGARYGFYLIGVSQETGEIVDMLNISYERGG